MKEIIVVGGGLAGLISSIELAQSGYLVTLFEKKKYPFHRVCGEYISNEVAPYFSANQLLPDLELPQIQQFELSSIRGKSLQMPLDLGGFGLSRFALDQHLVNKASALGVQVHEQTTILSCVFSGGKFLIETSIGRQFESDLVIGAYGKNSILDKKLSREFTSKRSPFLGVKYHVKTDAPKNTVSLHNFEGGYCGFSAIEDGKYNLCYLGSRSVLKKYGSIAEMEENVLCKNPQLRHLFKNSDFLFDKPEVINEFSFAPKKLIENHILMAGDAAGLITPLCGNGMAMAIHSGKILADLIKVYWAGDSLKRTELENAYLKEWNALFKRRLWVGRQTQKLFGTKFSSELAVGLVQSVRPLAKRIMKNTHGEPFQ